jgi:hypothetical protein
LKIIVLTGHLRPSSGASIRTFHFVVRLAAPNNVAAITKMASTTTGHDPSAIMLRSLLTKTPLAGSGVCQDNPHHQRGRVTDAR